MCTYWIKVLYRTLNHVTTFSALTHVFKAPAGKKIEVKLVSISDGLAVDGCQYAGVEIKTHKDQKLTGYRFENLQFFKKVTSSM